MEVTFALRSALAMMAFAGSFLLAACGGDEEAKRSEPAASAPAGPDAGGGGSQPARLSIDAIEPGPGQYAFSGTPSDVLTAGTLEIAFTNQGEQSHEFQLIRIDEGHTSEEVKALLFESETPPIEGPTPEWLQAAGGPVAAPGESGTSQVVLSAGEYAYVCFIPDANEVPHFKNGMFGSFSVGGDDRGVATLPSTDANVTAREYSFEVSGLKAGKNTFTFQNAGDQRHHAVMFPIAEDRPFADVEALFLSEEPPSPEGPPPPIEFGSGTGTTIMEAGGSYVTEVTLKAGRYAFVCFVSDPGDAPPHFTMGMLQEVVIE